MTGTPEGVLALQGMSHPYRGRGALRAALGFGLLFVHGRLGVEPILQRLSPVMREDS